MSWLDRLFPPKPHIKLTRTSLRWNLETRFDPTSNRYGARLNLTNRQVGELLAILNELERRGSKAETVQRAFA
jgi:hypothetical protein